jgi:hypothetical protein
MVSRWAYEANMVYQFKKNRYNEPLYGVDRSASVGFINTFYVIPELKNELEYCRSNFKTKPDSVDIRLKAILSNMKYYAKHFDVFPYENLDLIRIKTFNVELADDLAEYIEYLDLYFLSLYQNSQAEKVQLEQTLTDSLGEDYLSELKANYMNRAVNRVVTNSQSETIISHSDAHPAIKIDQIYQYPRSDLGRAQLFLPEKMINGQLIDTVEFNISIIWLINLLIYVVLVTGVIANIRKQGRNSIYTS